MLLFDGCAGLFLVRLFTGIFKKFLLRTAVMKIPYVLQITDASCSAAVLEMILRSIGIPRSQKQIIRRLNFDDSGATNSSLSRFLDRLSIPHTVYAQKYLGDRDHPATLLKSKVFAHLLAELDQGKMVLLNYLDEDDEGHYVLAHRHTTQYLIVHDPHTLKGPNTRIDKKWFQRRWRSKSGRWKKWFLVIERK